MVIIKLQNMKELIIPLAAAAALLTCSCGTPEGTNMDRIPIFKIVPKTEANPDGEYEIPGKGGSADFTVMSSGTWSASISGSQQFTLSENAGSSGKTVLKVISPSNTSDGIRRGTLSVTANGETLSYPVMQPIVLPYLDTDPANTTILAGEDETFTVKIEAAMDSWEWSFVAPVDWLTQSSKTIDEISFHALENNTGTERDALIRFYLTDMPEVFALLSVTQQALVTAPKADLLDVVFDDKGFGTDVSGMGMTVEMRASATMGVEYIDKYKLYAATFEPGGVLAKQESGYYAIEYNDNEAFKSALEDGYTLEVLFCRSDDPGSTQIKPFSSTQAGGTGICFRAKAGNEINFETHVAGAWKELYSGVTPEKGNWYHAVGSWNKNEGVAKLYVNGELTVTLAAAGSFKFMDTSVGKRWFGIGADPNANNEGEATFSGKVAIARLYKEPLTDAQVFALWRNVR